MPKLLSLIIAASVGLFAVPSSASELDRAALFEASTAFDQENVAPFLRRVAAQLQSGFSESDAEKLANLVGKLGLEETQSWEYSVSFQGKSVPLVIEAFQDDYEAPDLYFFTSRELAGRINEEIDAFAEQLGQ